MTKRLLFVAVLSVFCFTVNAQTWIWYPGDYEIWLGNEMNNRRTERGSFYPPFWKEDSHYALVEFDKSVDLPKPEEITIVCEGQYNIKIDGNLQSGTPKSVLVLAGQHTIKIKVFNQVTPPCIYINGDTIKSDSSWKVTHEDKEWIDQGGKTSDTSTTVYEDAM